MLFSDDDTLPVMYARCALDSAPPPRHEMKFPRAPAGSDLPPVVIAAPLRRMSPQGDMLLAVSWPSPSNGVSRPVLSSEFTRQHVLSVAVPLEQAVA